MASARATGRRPGPRSTLGDDARETLYQVALACFERDGIRRTSMERIAREAGVSRPTVNYYFSGKDALVLEVVTREAAAILGEMLAATEHLTGLERVVEAAVLGIRASIGNQYVRTLISPDNASTTTRLLESDAVMKLERDFWRPLLDQARTTEPALRDDLDYDHIIEWILLLQFAITSQGQSFGMTSEDSVRTRLRQFLLPALQR